nr:hypothetical protein [uncultured Dysosmobacter sp.]
MGKGKGKQHLGPPKRGPNKIQRDTARSRVVQDATRQTFQQYMTDCLMLALNDPEIMGKDVFGYKRLKKVLAGWGRKYDLYFDAMTKNPEADYARAKMDESLRRIIPDPDFLPFEERYDWLPEIKYGPKGGKGK